MALNAQQSVLSSSNNRIKSDQCSTLAMSAQSIVNQSVQACPARADEAREAKSAERAAQ